MHKNINKYTHNSSQKCIQHQPKPGEIWQVSPSINCPIESSQLQQQLYSLAENSPAINVMIVTEENHYNDVFPQEWQVISVMLLSEKTQFISDVDILISSAISGLAIDVLAQTWLIEEMFVSNLAQPIGKRLSRHIYDLLINVGDYNHGIISQAPTVSEIQFSSLKVGTKKALENSQIIEFHQYQLACSDILSLPVAAYRTYLKSMNFAESVLAEALQVEQELITNIAKEANKINILSQWLQNKFDTEWQLLLQTPSLAIATRSSVDLKPDSDENEIAKLIQQISEQDENDRRKAVKRLGEIAIANPSAIEALVKLVRSNPDDETLWIAVESLWKINPGNPAAGVRRVKLIDLGMQLKNEAVALAVALVPIGDRHWGVLLQVYSTDAQNREIATTQPLLHLPPGVKLILLSETGDILREVTARNADVYIQLKFSGERGEKFSVKVALDQASITEDFEI